MYSSTFRFTDFLLLTLRFYFDFINQIQDQMYRDTKSAGKLQQKAQLVMSITSEARSSLLYLRNSLLNIGRRQQLSALSKIINFNNQKRTLANKLKYLSIIAERIQKEKKLFAFHKLTQSKILKKQTYKSVANLMLILKRLVKSKLKLTISKLSVKQSQSIMPVTSRESIRSRSIRNSQNSQIFQVSEDSMNGSRALIWDQQREFSKQQILALRRENEELKRMVLSEQARESLKKMQRFDRYIYNMQSQKILKEPIANQLRRLEKMKNEFKQMRAKFYDNQLTVTCLFNHIKLVSEINRELSDSNSYKLRVTELEAKIAELNTHHRKQIAELKKKILFLDFSGNKSQRDSVDPKVVDKTPQKNMVKESKQNELTSEELTTLNIIMSAVKSRNYKDARRQIDYFCKKSKKQHLLMVIKQFNSLIEHNQELSSSFASSDKSRVQLIHRIGQFDKFLRNQKLNQLQALKNRCQSQKMAVEVVQLFEETISCFQDAQGLRKKNALSASKDQRSAEQEKLKKSVQNENEELRKEIKTLQIRISDLKSQKAKLEESLKKAVTRPSLPPRRPISNDKDQPIMQQNKAEQVKKLKENQFKLQRQIEQLNKQLTQLKQKLRISNQSYQIKQLNFRQQISNAKENEKVLEEKLKQFTSGQKYYGAIMEKKQAKLPYQREINEFKRYYPQSIFINFFSLLQVEQVLTKSYITQLKSLVTLFSDNSWKRKLNFNFKEEGEIPTLLNSLLQICFTVHQQRDDLAKSSEELRKREVALNDQLNKAKEELTKQKDTLSKSIQQQSNKKLPSKSLTQPSKQEEIQTAVLQKQITESSQKIVMLNKEIEKLREQVNSLTNQLNLARKTEKSPQKPPQPSPQAIENKEKANQLNQFLRFYNIIRKKQAQGLSYVRQLNELRKYYSESSLVKLLEEKLNLQSFINKVSISIKNTCSIFRENTWKKRSNLLFSEQSEVYIQLNELIEIVHTFAKERQECLRLQKQLESMKSKNNQLVEQSAKNKSELQKIKQDLLKSTEQSTKIKSQLSSKIVTLEANLRNKQNYDLNQSNLKLQQTSAQLEKIRTLNASLKSQVNQLQKHLQQVNQQNNRLTIEINVLQNDLSTTKLQLKKRQSSSSVKQEQKIYTSKGENKNFEQIVRDLQAKLMSSEQKLSNYKILFEKTKSERDNLKLILEQKNQQFEMSKQNQEHLQNLKKMNEDKIIQLKHSYFSTEIEVMRIETEVEKLLKERELFLSEKSIMEKDMRETIFARQSEIQSLKKGIQQRQNMRKLVQNQFEQLRRRAEFDLRSIQQQNIFLQRNLQNTESQLLKVRSNQQVQIQKLVKKIETSHIELSQYKKDFQMQRLLLRQKISQLSQLHVSVPIPTQPIQDHQKLQLRRQLQLTNEQLAVTLRNSQNEKRQLRKYIENLLNDGQNQSIHHNEEKRILREEIERARNEQYEINQERIRKLKEDIQVLRLQNERLISIIDANETSFNSLIDQHKAMSDEIKALEDHKHQLESSISLSEHEKNQLLRRVQDLETKLSEFQQKIYAAMNEGIQKEEEYMRKSQTQVAQLQASLYHINQQKNFLIHKNQQLNRQLIDIKRYLIKLSAQNSTAKRIQISGSSANDVKGQYSQYLETILASKDLQINSLLQKEEESHRKIKQLMQQLSRQRSQQQFIPVHDNPIEIHSNLELEMNTQKELIMMHEKIIQMESIIYSKEEQITSIKNIQNTVVETNELQSRITSIEAEKQKIQFQNNRLKVQVQQYNRNKAFYEQKLQENQRLSLQVKRLINKIALIQQQTKQIEHNYLQSQSQVLSLQNKLQEYTFNYSINLHSANLNQSGADSSLKQELSWYKHQLKLKEDQLVQIRVAHSSLSQQIVRYQQSFNEYALKQERYIRQSRLLEQARSRLRLQQQSFNSDISNWRRKEDSLKHQITIRQSEIISLRNQNKSLTQRFSSLEIKFASSTKLQNQFLLEIAKQLDQNYEIEGQEEQMQLKILQKISYEIGELIELNSKFKKRCDRLEAEIKPDITPTLAHIFRDLSAFLKANQLLNPEQMPEYTFGVDAEQFGLELAAWIKGAMLALAKQGQDESIRCNSILQNIKGLIDEYYKSNDAQVLHRLRECLSSVF